MFQTLLHDWHVARGAKMAPFAGFDMPISYPTGAVEEHLICRRSVGLFDIDHMGQFEISGPGSDAFLSSLVSSRILDMPSWEARYALLLDESGFVLDDLFIYRLPESWWVVVNASNRAADLAWMQARASASVRIQDRSEETYMIAVQGPKAIQLLDSLGPAPGAVEGVPRFHAARLSLLGIELLFGRTGYTGEDGGELFLPASRALELWEGILAQGSELGIESAPIGLAARDSLRFEAGMPLHGHEISPAINPVEAGFKWACDLEKDFVGKASILKILESGPSRRLVGLEVTGGVPREGCAVLAPAEAGLRQVGICAAGMYCPTVGKYAANAFVQPEFAKLGSALEVLIRDRGRPALVIKRPLYLPAYRR